MKDWKRTLTIGTVWGLIYFGWWMRSFMRDNWEFNIFAPSHYQFVWSEFIKGWKISALSEWIFVITLIVALPVFLFAWRWFLKIQWKKLAKKVWSEIVIAIKGKPKQATTKKLESLKPKSSKSVRPRALEVGLARPIPKQDELKVPVAPNEKSPYATEDSFSSSLRNPSTVAPRNDFDTGPSGFGGFDMGGGSSFGNFGQGLQKDFGMPNMSGSAFGGGSSSSGMPSFMHDEDLNTPLDDIKLPERQHLDEDLDDVFKSAGYTVVKSVIMDGLAVDYVAVAADKIIVAVLDSEKGDWLADEERFNGEEPLWFSESSHRTSPIFTLGEKVKSFAERLTAVGVTASVQPMLIEQAGSIINAEDMVQVWQDLDVLVARTGAGGPDELPATVTIVPASSEPADSELVEKVKGLLV